jgi:hypothetical protein
VCMYRPGVSFSDANAMQPCQVAAMSGCRVSASCFWAVGWLWVMPQGVTTGCHRRVSPQGDASTCSRVDSCGQGDVHWGMAVQVARRACWGLGAEGSWACYAAEVTGGTVRRAQLGVKDGRFWVDAMQMDDVAWPTQLARWADLWRPLAAPSSTTAARDRGASVQRNAVHALCYAACPAEWWTTPLPEAMWWTTP